VRVAVYYRVSTLEQSDAMQRRDLAAYCAARGWQVVAEFADAGVSGARERRPGLDRLMLAARRREFDAVAVWAFDRFARSTRHLLQALEEFRSLGVQFVSYREALDTATPLGQAVFTIVAAVAELERNLIRERIRAGVASARARGVRCGRRPRRVDTELAQMLQAEGRGQRQIARLMNISRGTLRRALAAAHSGGGDNGLDSPGGGAGQKPAAENAAPTPETAAFPAPNLAGAKQ
jgi:DNA invertase Pin-like site-specific DNA recombinase